MTVVAKIGPSKCTLCGMRVKPRHHVTTTDALFCSYDHALDWYRENDKEKVAKSLVRSRGRED